MISVLKNWNASGFFFFTIKSTYSLRIKSCKWIIFLKYMKKITDGQEREILPKELK